MPDELHGPGARPAPPSPFTAPPSAGHAAVPDWRPWLAGGTPREVLARIVPGDPLQIRARVARRLRAEALLVDADRAHLRALARCARAAPRYGGRPDLSTWLDARVAEALADLLREDAERGASSAEDEPGAVEPSAVEPGAAEPDRALVELARPLGLDARALARACRAFNRLAPHERHAFFGLVLEARSLDELVRTDADGRDATTLARSARHALRTLLAHVERADGVSADGPDTDPDESAPSSTRTE